MEKKYKLIVNKIRDLFHEPAANISLHEPRFWGNEKKYLNECIDTTYVSSVGKFVDQFEIEIAKFTGVKKAVSVVNGTNALHLALKLVGVKQGDEVITQPLTFIATANAISYCDAKPVFLDVDRDTMGLSPVALRKWLEENVEMREVKNKTSQPNPQPLYHAYNKNTGKRISACVPMHTFGHPCRIDEIVEICNKYNISVVEDAAESLGSFYLPSEMRGAHISQGSPHEISSDIKKVISLGKGQHTGTFGRIGVLSFNGNKILTTGGGGMLLFNDIKLAQKAKHLTTQAKVPHPWEFVHDEIAYNYRMPNINAALGLAQLENLEKYIAAKRNLAKEYGLFFETLGIKFFKEQENSKANYWLNILILENRKERDEFLEYTNAKGVMTRPVWELMNRLQMFKDCQCGDLTNTEWLADRVVNLPSRAIS